MANPNSTLQTRTCTNCQIYGRQCDNGRPLCSSCLLLQASTPQPVLCDYDASSRQGRETAKEKKARLEQRIQELEALLSNERQEVREQTNVARPTNITTNLPSQNILAHLVGLFFDRVPSAHLIIDRNTLVPAINLARDHRDYPAASILHAICAVTSLFAESVPGLQTTQSSNSRVTQGFQHATPLDPMNPEAYGTSFGERQARFAHAAMEVAHQPGTLTSVQANILLSWFYFAFNYSTRALCASADSLRTSNWLGLPRTHQPIMPWAATLPQGSSSEQVGVEIERQRCVWWLAYATARWQNANTSWPTLLDDEDVTQVLPLPLGIPTASVSPASRQQISTPGMFVSHPPGLTDSFVLFVKGAIVLSLVKTFNLRWDAPYRHSSDGRPDARTTPMFIEIDTLLIAFEKSVCKFPFLGRGVDQHMLLARATPHVATILLHEQHAQPIDHFCKSTERMTYSARQIWVLMQELNSAQVDASFIDPIFSVVLAVACRVFLRLIDVRLSEGRTDEATMFKPEAELLRLGLQSMSRRYPLAVNQVSTLDNRIRGRLGRRYEQIGQSFATSHLH